MRVLVITRAGGRIQSKKTVTASWLRVGRNASCEVHLPDPRIALEQGLITQPDAGFLYVEGDAVGSQSTTRKAVKSVRMKVGEPIEVGPYRLELKPAPAGYDGAVQVELVSPPVVAEDLASRTSRLTLGSLGLSKRWAAWLWALGVIALFLLVPAGRVLDLPWRDATRNPTFGDRFWNPGRVILAHQPIESDCAACHEVAFQHVKDRACLECHAKIGAHSAPEKTAALFEGTRCASCHRDHKGVKATHRDDDAFCVSCHRDIRAHAKDADAKNVGDFAADHPGFRLSLPSEGGVRRVRQGEGAIVESTSLMFPHDKHLDPAGVRSPLQGRVKLDCKSCHAPDAARVGFEPVSMARHCQECHQLQFEPAVTTREVPHGKPAAALVVIEEFYASLALQGLPDSFQKAFGVPGEGLLRRVGEPTPVERESALRLAQRKARKVGEELFEVRVCKTCHAVTRIVAPAAEQQPSPRQAVSRGGAQSPEWQIAPVRQNTDWMPQARFSHKSHPQVKCAECHAVATSKKATDVSMPTIDTCRKCHGGSRPSEGKVMSNCLLCHAFHDARHAWDPLFEPKGRAQAARATNAR